MFLKDISPIEIEKYNLFFKANDYVLIKNILTDEAINILNNSIEFTNETLKDKPQFGRRHNINMNDDLLIKQYQTETIDFYKKIIGNDYRNTFAFAMEYIKNSEVLPHLDFIFNEVSSTTCYYTDESYPIYISSEYIENNYNHRYSIKNSNLIDDSKKIEINIECGDIGIFNGRNHLHWRNKLEKDIKYRAILSHYGLTEPGSKEWIKKTSQSVPYENSVDFIYNKK